MNGGGDTPDFEENDRPQSQHAHRAHLRTDSRSASPAANFARGEISQLTQSFATLNNGRSSSPPPLPARFGSSSGTKDSFLNYFFGKEGLPGPSGVVPRTAPSESSFAQGFKRNTPDINGLASPTFEPSRLAKDFEDVSLVGSLYHRDYISFTNYT